MPYPEKFDLEKFLELSLKPRSDKELAEIFGVTPKSIRVWRQRPDVQARIKSDCTAQIYAYLPSIVHTLCKQASKGDIKAAGIVFELAGMNQPGAKDGNTSITVVVPQGIQLPDQFEKKVIEVQAEEVKIENIG